MLIEFFGRNFGPFRDEFRLSMLATDIDPGDQRGVVEVPLEGESKPLRLLRCAAIYGPNASGKSNVLKAAGVLGHFLWASSGFESVKPITPFVPFFLDEYSREQPVMLGLHAVIDHCVYEYVIEFDMTQFSLERLVELGPDERILFERHGQDVSGDWQSEPQFALLTDSFRPNALLLSLADRLAPSLAGKLASRIQKLLGMRDFSRNPAAFLPSQYVARRAYEEADGFGIWLTRWLKDADVGIVGYDTKEVPFSTESNDKIQATTSKRKSESEVRLTFTHAGSEGTVLLSNYLESVGTLKIAELAPYIYDLLHGDEIRAYFIDEIGASVHPTLLKALINEFNCETPPEHVRGQLIFATHETLMLDAEAKSAPLRRDQIYLTEKDSAGACRLYSLAEFKERNNLNLRRRYLQGRYGALPSPGRLGRE